MTALHAGAYRMATEIGSWIAAQPGDWDPNSGRDPEWGKAAPAGLLIWLFLGVMLFLLIKSMNRHMRRVPASFDGENAGDGVGGDADGGNAAPGNSAPGDSAPGDEDEASMTLPADADDPGAAADAVADGSDTRSA